ncbi:MAG: hypothetical protein ACLSV2_08500 [Clostridium sp.]
MNEVTIKGVGKKLIINGEKIVINKTIGKNLEILIHDITDISYDKGTMNKNGNIHIRWTNECGKSLEEDVMFRCFSNDIVDESVNSILNHLKNLNEPLIIKESEKNSFFKQINEEAREQIDNKAKEKLEEKKKLEELEKQAIPYCPKCHSTSISTTDKKLSLGRAAVGGVLLGETGAILGGLSSKKVQVICLNCGYKWKPSKR